MSSNVTPVVIETTATQAEMNNIPYRLRSKLAFIANDSPDRALKVNFDNSIDQLGTFTLYAGEVLSDIQMSCVSVSLQGVGGNVPVRMLGV